ncbi:MAG: hypothetical protein QM687_04960 [Ferruginibacter sp.]
MKIKNDSGMPVIAAISIALMLMFSGCNDETGDKYCNGYTGKITNEQSLALVNKCHFLSKDSIELWTKKYEVYRKELGGENDSLSAVMDKMSASFLKSGSVSFNSCIVKKILCHKNSIGLRALYGIGSTGKLHIILVGIQPDYSNLYVDAAGCCNDVTAADTQRTLSSGTSGNLGGAEYGQMP